MLMTKKKQQKTKNKTKTKQKKPCANVVDVSILLIQILTLESDSVEPSIHECLKNPHEKVVSSLSVLQDIF